MTSTGRAMDECLLDVGSTAHLSREHGTPLGVANARIALFRVGGRVVAVEDACLRCSSPLSEGRLEGAIVACARCGWAYDLDAGSVMRLPALRLNAFPVRVERTRILLEWTPPPT